MAGPTHPRNYPRLHPLERRGGEYRVGAACGQAGLARSGCDGLQDGLEGTRARQARGIGGGATAVS